MARLSEIPPPEISVIIPTLNEESTIEEALQALLSCPDAGRFEVSVADGGSRDATAERARPFVCVLSAPRGRAVQMNAGARAARGNILLYMGLYVQQMGGDPEPIYKDALDGLDDGMEVALDVAELRICLHHRDPDCHGTPLRPAGFRRR